MSQIDFCKNLIKFFVVVILSLKIGFGFGLGAANISVGRRQRLIASLEKKNISFINLFYCFNNTFTIFIFHRFGIY